MRKIATCHPGRKHYGLGLCKYCYHIEWNRRSTEKVAKYRVSQKDAVLKKTFGISLNEYQILLETQNGVCAICGRPERTVHRRGGAVRTLAVDHNHRTGRIRGLLCATCNTLLGRIENVDIDIFLSYLRRHR
jgi:Recombination endonuclease VII